MSGTTELRETQPAPSADRRGDGSVLVGIDNSRRSQGAIEWAADDATARNAPLHLLHVIDERRFPLPVHPLTTDDQHGWHLLDRVGDELTARYPGLQLRRDLATGDVGAELVGHSRNHAAVVVGRRGSGGFVRMLIGSTAFRVANEALVPVVVVPDNWEPGTRGVDPVVLGVDYRDSQPAAMRFAFEEARRRGVRLVAAHGRDVPAIDWDVPPASVAEEPSAQEALAAAIEPMRGEFPEVEVELLCSDSHPLTVLLDEAPSAQLLVVGRHGKRGGGLPFGSVARAALHYAEVPLAVVPAAGTEGS
jgi:nucleotide-binding universal stress UspA family protein